MGDSGALFGRTDDYGGYANPHDVTSAQRSQEYEEKTSALLEMHVPVAGRKPFDEIKMYFNLHKLASVMFDAKDAFGTAKFKEGQVRKSMMMQARSTSTSFDESDSQFSGTRFRRYLYLLLFSMIL